MLADQRHAYILELIQRSGWVRVNELAARLDVSPMTIRRDLAALDAIGRVRRRRGGAERSDDAYEPESSFRAKANANNAAKRGIARVAVSLVRPGQSLFLDAGTTVLALARLLEPIRNLTVVTNDLTTALALCDTPVRLYFIGGAVQGETASVIAAASSALDFSVDIAFFGTRTISDDFDVCTPTQAKVAFKRAVRERAAFSYLLADLSKFGKRSLFRIDGLADYSGVITDKTFGPDEAAVLRTRGIRIIQAMTETNPCRT